MVTQFAKQVLRITLCPSIYFVNLPQTTVGVLLDHILVMVLLAALLAVQVQIAAEMFRMFAKYTPISYQIK